MSAGTWEEPGGGVHVRLLPEETIVIRRGRTDDAEVVENDRAGYRLRRFQPREIGVRYLRTPDGWSMEITIGGPSVRADGSPGSTYHFATYRPGDERPPFWAAAFAVAQHPDPDGIVRWVDPA